MWQAAGARTVVLVQTSATAPQAFSPDGDPSGITIPVVMIDKGDGDALRAALCPSVENGRCTTTPDVTASLRDARGEWGALRVVDVTDPAVPREVQGQCQGRDQQSLVPSSAARSGRIDLNARGFGHDTLLGSRDSNVQTGRGTTGSPLRAVEV